MASKRGRPTGDGPNKSEFIRDRPNKKPAEIIADADKQGFKLSGGLIYAVRSADKTKTPKAAKAGPSPGIASLGSLDGAIRALVKQELKALLQKL
jgi:hypothetical protein